MIEQEPDPAAIHTNPMDELRQSAVMLRTWMPEAFPANSSGQVHFVRAVVESVATVIDRVLADDAAYKATAEEIHANYLKAHVQRNALQQAIGAIWRADVYEGRKKENGVSIELVHAIRGAAREAGFGMVETETV